MANFLFIIFICYVPVASSFLPKIFGDIGVEWPLFYVLLLVFILSRIIKSRLRFFHPWLGFILFYVIFVCLSLLWSPYRSYDLFNIERLVARYVVPLCVAVIALNLFAEPENVKTFLRHVCFGAVIMAVYALCQKALNGLHGDLAFRAMASFNNPNALAIFLVLTLPAIMYSFDEHIIPGRYAVIILVIVVLGILSTVSRKGVATAGFSFFLYFLLLKQYKKLLIFSVLFFVIVLSFAGYSGLTERVEKNIKQHELKSRWGAAFLGLKMFADHPLIGLGYRGYVDNSKKYRGVRFGRSLMAHNIYATVLANYGLLGFIPFMFIFLYPLLSARKFFKDRNTGKSGKMFATVCIVSVLAFMINGWFAGGLSDRWYAINLLYSMIALHLGSV